MIYYTEEKHPVEFDFDKLAKDLINDTGCQGYVYRYGNNQCIKFYFSEQPRGLQIYTKEKFDFFKNLDLENYCSLDTVLYRDETLKKIGAFIMQYYESSDVSILDMPIEYILHNFEIHYRNAEILSENRILMHDLHKKNVIIGNENMTIIDFDSYYKQRISRYKSLLRKNTIILLELMKSLYLEELKRQELNSPKAVLLLEDIYSYSDEPVKQLSKKLKGVKRSIDLF